MPMQNHCKSRDQVSTQPLKTWTQAEYYIPFWIMLVLGHAVHIGSCKGVVSYLAQIKP